jgi:hypothetical protein
MEPDGKEGHSLWSVEALHDQFCHSLEPLLQARPSLDAILRKPLDLYGRPPLPPRLRLYAFNATDHPSERRAGDYRIQLRLPGQAPRTRGHLAVGPGILTVLAGYVSEFDVFVLWDPRAHEAFPYSKGVQVAASTVHIAAIKGIAEQPRVIRSRLVSEVVIAVRSDHLVDGIVRREDTSRKGLLDDSNKDRDQ